MHLTMSRPSPYTGVPPPLHALQRAGATGYGVTFAADPSATTNYSPPQSFYSSSAFQSTNGYGSSCSYSAPLYSGVSLTTSNERSSYGASSSLCSPQSPSDTSAFSPSSNGATSPNHTPSPQLNNDCTSMKPQCCHYPSPAMHQMSCNSFFPHSSLPTTSSATPSTNSDQSLPSAPIANGFGGSYGLVPQTTSSMYQLPDYHTQYPSPLGFSSNPSFSSMALWNYQSVGQYPKVSYDTPRYKLTPERALPLIKWFEDHKDHPYPSRHEKMLLCQSTLLTFTQVSTWFANARRRMKKAAQEEGSTSSEDSSCSDREGGSPSQ